MVYGCGCPLTGGMLGSVNYGTSSLTTAIAVPGAVVIGKYECWWECNGLHTPPGWMKTW